VIATMVMNFAPSSACQTTWALLALISIGNANHIAVENGIRFLQNTQHEDGLWQDENFTGGGLPHLIYLCYHGYQMYFPLWALACYSDFMQNNSHNWCLGFELCFKFLVDLCPLNKPYRTLKFTQRSICHWWLSIVSHNWEPPDGLWSHAHMGLQIDQ
jgi:hypothetical protein